MDKIFNWTSTVIGIVGGFLPPYSVSGTASYGRC